jgi:hypothetical protein
MPTLSPLFIFIFLPTRPNFFVYTHSDTATTAITAIRCGFGKKLRAAAEKNENENAPENKV